MQQSENLKVAMIHGCASSMAKAVALELAGHGIKLALYDECMAPSFRESLETELALIDRELAIGIDTADRKPQAERALADGEQALLGAKLVVDRDPRHPRRGPGGRIARAEGGERGDP